MTSNSGIDLCCFSQYGEKLTRTVSLHAGHQALHSPAICLNTYATAETGSFITYINRDNQRVLKVQLFFMQFLRLPMMENIRAIMHGTATQ